MKKLKISTLFLLIFASSAFAQQVDAAAMAVLERASQSIQRSSGIEADFSMEITNAQAEILETSNGNLWLRGDRFRLSIDGMDIFFDGTTQWIFVEENNEVVISSPTEEELQEINPTAIITSYKTNYQLRKDDNRTIDGRSAYVVSAFPMDRNRPYHRIELVVERSTHNLLQVTTFGRNGINVQVQITNYRQNQNIPNNFFVFNAQQHPNIEIIDLR